MMTEEEAEKLSEYYERNDPKIIESLGNAEIQQLKTNAAKWKNEETKKRVNAFSLSKIKKTGTHN
jgi:hypothetical protein